MILQPPAVLCQGAPGSGKTDALPTLIEAGLDLFVIVTEPDGAASLIDSVKRRRLDIDRLHYCEVMPAAPGWSAMDDMVSNIANKSYEGLQEIKSGIGKTETRKPAMALLSALKNFRCDRTGQEFGDTSTWDASRALALDSLSGLSLMAWALTIGYKPTAHQGEWGVAMNFIEQLLLKMTSDRRCFFAMTAHIEKEPNLITGANQVMASTLGRKLAPKVPRFFSEVVWATRTLDGKTPKFRWSTVDNQADLKSRALPISDDLLPTYVLVVEAYRTRVRVAGETAAAPALQPPPALPVPPAAPMTRAAQGV